MIFKDLDRIVFAGDSITDMGSDQPVGDGSLWDSLGRGYVRMIDNYLASHYPEIRVRVTNSGINGQTSSDLLARFDRDVIDLKPDYISIFIGANDVWRQFDSPSQTDQQVDTDVYRENMIKMIEKSIKAAKKVFIFSPYYMEPLREDKMRSRMEDYAAVCKELALKYGCEYVDVQAMFDKYFQFRHSSYIAWDRIHPNQVGAMLIAKEFLRHCDFDFTR